MPSLETNTPEETHALGVRFGQRLKPGDVVAFRGGLGAGKTTFTRGIAEGLGIPAFVSSPTFAIVNEYRGDPTSLYHFDLYRVSDFDSLESTGFFDYLESGNILVIEWSEQLADELPENTILVTIRQDLNRPEHRVFEIAEGFWK